MNKNKAFTVEAQGNNKITINPNATREAREDQGKSAKGLQKTAMANMADITDEQRADIQNFMQQIKVLDKTVIDPTTGQEKHLYE